jgi:hypothetical protein
MVGLYRSNRIKDTDMICRPPNESETSGVWVTVSESTLAKYGMMSNASTSGGSGAIEKYSAMREVFAARVQCYTHDYNEICNVCRYHEEHSTCDINENLPVGTTATVLARLEEERLLKLQQEEEMKKHEKQLAFERRRIGSAGRIQGWFRGYLGRQWGKRYMSRVKDERNARFQEALLIRNRKKRFSYKLLQVGKCIINSPLAIVRVIKGPGLTEEEQIKKDKENAKRKIEAILNNRYAVRLQSTCTIQNDSKEVILHDTEWNSINVNDGTGQRKIKRRDRLRFQIGLKLLGNDNYEQFEFSIDEINSKNPYNLFLTKNIEGEWDETDTKAQVWWCPPITEDEIKERFKEKKKNDALKKKAADKLKERQKRVSLMAERFGEDSAVAKRMKRAAGIEVEGEEDEEDEEEKKEEEDEEDDEDSNDDDEEDSNDDDDDDE